MVKADIDFEKELWDAENELLGAVTEIYYKNYILPLAFVKHYSKSYEVVLNLKSRLMIQTPIFALHIQKRSITDFNIKK